MPYHQDIERKNANSFKESNNTVLLNTRDEQAKFKNQSLIKLMLIVHLWCTSPPPPPPPPPLQSPPKIELANRLSSILLLVHKSQGDFALVM